VGQGRLVEITTTFLGVVGSVSPLANYFTEDILRAESVDDRTLRDFYDVFHHRLIGLVYRAHLRGAPWSMMRTDAADCASRRSLAMIGQSIPLPNSPLSGRQRLALARVFVRRPRGREGLEAALALAFPEAPIRLLDFLGRSIPLEQDQRARLGVRHVTLGRGARLGRHLTGQTGLLRLLVGPLDRTTFEAFLPGGAEYSRLCGLVAERTGGMLDCEAEIEIRCGEEPRARLGKAHGTRLGATGLVGRPRADHPMRVRVPLTDGAAGPRQRPLFLAAPA
jgi:type VI secretion system protein ImpH